MDSAQVNYEALLGLPIVQELLRKNKKLRKENRSLRNLICSLPEFRCRHDRSVQYTETPVIDLRAPVNIKIETEQEPTQCDTLIDDDEVVLVQKPLTENVIYVIDDLDDAEEVEEFEQEDAVVIKEAEEEAEVDAEEPAAQNAEDGAEEEEEAEEEAEKEEDAEEEAEEDAEEEEEVDAEEPAAQNAEDEVFEIQISGKAYYTTNEIHGIIYAVDENEDVGDEVGKFNNGKPTFYKK